MRSITIYIASILLFITSCNTRGNKVSKEKNNTALDQSRPAKPPAHTRDTLLINFSAAVFYHPDSLQLEKIKSNTQPGVYDATMHEYFYQMRNARMSIKRDYPELKIVETKNIRFLLFKGKDDDSEYIDLNSKNDPYGLFLFQPGKKPHFADMMNIDTELGFYFKN
jgi:hypothetical protein